MKQAKEIHSENNLIPSKSVQLDEGDREQGHERPHDRATNRRGSTVHWAHGAFDRSRGAPLPLRHTYCKDTKRARELLSGLTSPRGSHSEMAVAWRLAGYPISCTTCAYRRG